MTLLVILGVVLLILWAVQSIVFMLTYRRGDGSSR